MAIGMYDIIFIFIYFFIFCSHSNREIRWRIKHRRPLVLVGGDVKSGLLINMDTIYGTLRSPGSFGGIRNLQRYSWRSESDVKKFSSGQDAYTLYKSRRICFPHRRTYSKGIGDLFQIDLVDLSSLSSFNDGMRYLLTCIDVFSKRAWAVPVRRKSARDVTEAFERILTDQKCNMVQSDKGTEFLNSTFQTMLKSHNIHFYTSENEDLKAAVVKRFNRTL